MSEQTDTEPMSAFARCVCNSVALRILRRTPVLHLQCGCFDCRQAHEYLWSLGGPPTLSPPLEKLVYFQNDVAPLSEQELQRVRLTMLRNDGRSTRLETTCCNSILAVDHPAYQGNVFMVPAAVCHLDAPEIRPMARIYMKDWDEAADGPPPSLPEGCLLPKPTEGKPWRDVMGTSIKLPRQGVPLQDLYKQLAPSLTVLGLTEGARFTGTARRVHAASAGAAEAPQLFGHTTKRVHFLRHGQASHNPRAEAARSAGCSHDDFLRLMKEDDAFDAGLTDLGRAQAHATANAIGHMLDSCIELVVSSPLSRALDTSSLVLPKATARVPRIFMAHDDLRECSGWMLSAKRRSRTELAARYPECDFSLLQTEGDELWSEELEPTSQTAARGVAFLEWLSERPETEVAVVAHGGIFHYLLNECKSRVRSDAVTAARFHNCELRSCVLRWQGTGVARTFDLQMLCPPVDHKESSDN